MTRKESARKNEPALDALALNSAVRARVWMSNKVLSDPRRMELVEERDHCCPIIVVLSHLKGTINSDNLITEENTMPVRLLSHIFLLSVWDSSATNAHFSYY